jgi:hypothetical protein
MLGHPMAAMTLDRYGRLLDDDVTGVAGALGKVRENLASVRYDAYGEAEGGLLTVSKLAVVR